MSGGEPARSDFRALGDAWRSNLYTRMPPSLRRKFVCVVQVAVLCLILVPAIVQPVSSWLAAIALLLLCHSFAVDCFYLLTKAEVRE